MTIFTENALALAVAGGLLAALALVMFLARRTGGSLAALVGIVVATLALLLVERLVVTDGEQVESNLASVFAAIEVNDVSAVLAHVDPTSYVPAEIQVLMPLVQVEKARALGHVEVEVTPHANPPIATASFRAYLDGVHTNSGMRVAYFNQRVDVSWIKRGDRWLIERYAAYYDSRLIDAVDSAVGNRPVPSPAPGGPSPRR